MVAIHIEHKLDAGILTISRVRKEIAPNETDGDPESAEVIQFRFECGATGAWFDADMDRDELTKLCPILGVDDELVETLNEPPDITASENRIVATFNVVGRKQAYRVQLFLTRRTYAADKQDVMELRAENTVLRRKVDDQERRIVQLEKYCKKFQMDIAYLAIDAYRRTIGNVYEFPDGKMSDDVLGNLISSLCELRECIDPTWLFNAPYNNIMRAVERGIDPNQIVGGTKSQYPGMPLIFKILHDRPNTDDPNKKFDGEIKLIEYLLSHGQDVNVKYNDKTILTQFINDDAKYPAYVANIPEFNALPPMTIERMLASPIQHRSWTEYPGRGTGKCIEYIEYRDTILKMLRDAGAK